MRDILFDLDGTLWDSSKHIAKAFAHTLQIHDPHRPPLSKSFLQSLIGKTMDDILSSVFPDVDDAKLSEVMHTFYAEEMRRIQVYGGKLYPDLRVVLDELKKTYRLHILSNCQSGYIELFLARHDLQGYFTSTLCWGDRPVPKGENLKYILATQNISESVYVGDTPGDQKGAKEAGLPFIHAAYGFAKVENPDYSINSLRELPGLLKTL